MIEEWLDIGRFLLACMAVVPVAGFAIGVSFWRGWHRRVRWAVACVAGGLLLSAFLLWVWPTPWRQWQKGDQYFRRNLITGERQRLLECGCKWLPAER